MKKPETQSGGSLEPVGSARCEWLYNHRGYQCAAEAKWQTPCLMDDGTVKLWKLCDTHKTEVGTVLERLLPNAMPEATHENPNLPSAPPSGSAVYPTLRAAEEAHGPCPSPITEDGSHWWYNDWEAIERRTHRRGALLDSWPCMCKTCGLRVEIIVNAPDHPEV